MNLISSSTQNQSSLQYFYLIFQVLTISKPRAILRSSNSLPALMSFSYSSTPAWPVRYLISVSHSFSSLPRSSKTELIFQSLSGNSATLSRSWLRSSDTKSKCRILDWIYPTNAYSRSSIRHEKGTYLLYCWKPNSVISCTYFGSMFILL